MLFKMEPTTYLKEILTSQLVQINLGLWGTGRYASKQTKRRHLERETIDQSPCEVGKSLQNDGGKGPGTEGGNRGTGVPQPSKKPATEPIKPQGTSSTVRPTNTTRPSNTAKPTTTTRPTGGVSTPVKQVEKVDTNATKEKVSQPI